MEESKSVHSIRLPNTPFTAGTDAKKLGAYLSMQEKSEWQNSEANFGILVRMLEEAGFQNVNKEGLRDALPKILLGESFRFARALEPLHGEDGYIRFTFESNPAEKVWMSDESEKIDFRSRNEVNNVKKGDLLAEIVAPTAGVDGHDVMGAPIPARQGRVARLFTGKNVSMSNDQAKAYSEIDGCVKCVGPRLTVDPVMVIEGDVAFRTGDIEFNGDVVVMGDVNETFKVVAQGSISVSGTVDRARLKAGADITVNGGLYGKEGIEVEAAGNITLVFAENANLKAGGSIYVRASMINCMAEADSKIYFKSVGKSLIGGHVRASHGVEANCLGNPRIPTRTIVEFGLRPELAQRLRSLSVEFERSDEERKMEIRRELEELHEEFVRQSRARVIVRESVYPGIILVCGKAVFDVKTELAAVVYSRPEGKNEISMQAYNPLESGEE